MSKKICQPSYFFSEKLHFNRHYVFAPLQIHWHRYGVINKLPMPPMTKVDVNKRNANIHCKADL